MSSTNPHINSDKQACLFESPPKSVLPFLKWAGGKGQLVSVLNRYVPGKLNRYLEPFVGGGALFFHLQPPVSLLNDLNEELINTYKIVQNDVDALIQALSSYPYSRSFYYEIRAQNPNELDCITRAARFIYLNRTCFNGLYRVNKNNQFNVPFGRYSNPVICDEERLRAANHALQGVALFSEDYKTFLEREARAGDFIYIDPPYQPRSRYSDFKRYTSSFFYEKDQAELANFIRDLTARGCYILASNSNTLLTRKLYRGFELVTVLARRNINKDGSSRGVVEELIIACKR